MLSRLEMSTSESEGELAGKQPRPPFGNDGAGTQTRRRRQRTQSVGTFINEIEHREVEDVTLEAFYRPHNITLLVIAVAAVVVSAFVR